MSLPVAGLMQPDAFDLVAWHFRQSFVPVPGALGASYGFLAGAAGHGVGWSKRVVLQSTDQKNFNAFLLFPGATCGHGCCATRLRQGQASPVAEGETDRSGRSLQQARRQSSGVVNRGDQVFALGPNIAASTAEASNTRLANSSGTLQRASPFANLLA